MLSHYSHSKKLASLCRGYVPISQAYKEAVLNKTIEEDACQQIVVRYLDRFQAVMKNYVRGTIPEFEIIKNEHGKLISCGIYDSQEEAKHDLLFFGNSDKENKRYYIKPYLEPTTISNSVQKRKIVTTQTNQFIRLPTEVNRYRTYSQFNHTWKKPEKPMVDEKPSSAQEPDREQGHISYNELLSSYKGELSQQRGKMSAMPRIPRGIYLYGDVGTGKSFLMDLFYSTCEVNGGKCRVHFHEFMQDFHRQLHDYKEKQIAKKGRDIHLHETSEKDAIVQVAKRISLDNTLICFDEFHVTDIADALILSHIFETFYKSGSVVFTTSNHAPDNLYMNGLNRMFFLPFISLITTHSRVIDINSQIDYRRSLAHPVDDVVLTPCGDAANAVLYGMFPEISPTRSKEYKLSFSSTRSLMIPAAANGVCRIPFSMICEDDRGTDDYESVANAFHTVVITDVPQFRVEDTNLLSRFVKMIDQFYDHRTRIIMTSETDINHLFDRVFQKEDEIHQKMKQSMDVMEKGRITAISSLVFSCKRTQSRLIEMTGRNYLEHHALMHNTSYYVC